MPITPIKNKITRALATGVLASLGLIATAGCKSGLELATEWADDSIKVDGLMADWDGLSTRYLEEPPAVIGLANDSDRLYLLLRFRDPRWAQTIRMTGLTLWLDAKGKKNKDFALKFRGGPSPEQMQQMGGGQPSGTGGRMRGGDERLFTCAITDLIAEKSIVPDGTEGPSAAFSVDQGFFTYEFSVPLQESIVSYYGLGVEPGQKISIGARWGDTPDRGDHGGGPGGMGRPPGGGMPGGGSHPGGGVGGGRGGGPPGGMGGQRPEQSEAQEVWIKTTLAVPGDGVVDETED